MKTIDKNINIYRLYLTSLPEWMGEIDIVNGYFDCSNNLLTSLKGCPKEVKGSFYCSRNKLTSLEGCPKVVKGNFYCYGNPRKFTIEDVRKVCDVKGRIYC
jgi:hypothetical protein